MTIKMWMNFAMFICVLPSTLNSAGNNNSELAEDEAMNLDNRYDIKSVGFEIGLISKESIELVCLERKQFSL